MTGAATGMPSRLPAMPNMTMPPYEPRAADSTADERTPRSANWPPRAMPSSLATGAVMEKAMGLAASCWNCWPTRSVSSVARWAR